MLPIVHKSSSQIFTPSFVIINQDTALVEVLTSNNFAIFLFYVNWVVQIPTFTNTVYKIDANYENLIHCNLHLLHNLSYLPWLNANFCVFNNLVEVAKVNVEKSNMAEVNTRKEVIYVHKREY